MALSSAWPREAEDAQMKFVGPSKIEALSLICRSCRHPTTLLSISLRGSTPHGTKGRAWLCQNFRWKVDASAGQCAIG